MCWCFSANFPFTLYYNRFFEMPKMGAKKQQIFSRLAALRTAMMGGRYSVFMTKEWRYFDSHLLSWKYSLLSFCSRQSFHIIVHGFNEALNLCFILGNIEVSRVSLIAVKACAGNSKVVCESALHFCHIP